MSKLMLFCTTNGAAPLLSKIMDIDRKEFGGISAFYLIEHRDCPDDESFYRSEIKPDDTIATGFKGATHEECQQWALARWAKIRVGGEYLFFMESIMFIVDDRSLEDDTVLVQQFYKGDDQAWLFDGYGVSLPPRPDTWFAWRVKWHQAMEIHTALHTIYGRTVLPAYFGVKDELTDENGVFDVERAERLACLTEPFPQSLF